MRVSQKTRRQTGKGKIVPKLAGVRKPARQGRFHRSHGWQMTRGRCNGRGEPLQTNVPIDHVQSRIHGTYPMQRWEDRDPWSQNLQSGNESARIGPPAFGGVRRGAKSGITGL